VNLPCRADRIKSFFIAIVIYHYIAKKNHFKFIYLMRLCAFSMCNYWNLSFATPVPLQRHFKCKIQIFGRQI